MSEQTKIQKLLAELASSKLAYASSYIKAREGRLKGSERAPTDADARAGAQIALAAMRHRDPEIVRLELWSLIGMPRSEEE